MKKIIIFTLIILSLILTACDNSKDSGKVKSDTGKPIIIESGYGIANGGFAHCGIIVENKNKEQAFRSYIVRATAYDDNEGVIATEDQYMNVIAPKEKQGVSVLLDCNNVTPAKIEFKIIDGEKISESERVPSSKIKVAIDNVTNDGYAITKFSGTATNKSKKDMDQVYLCLLLKKSGKIVYSDIEFVNKLNKGATAPFSINAMSLPDYDSYEVIACDWSV